MTLFKTLAAAAALALAAGASQAGGVYATDVQVVVAGTNAGQAGRDDPANAEGVEDGVFYSLGRGGIVDVFFGRSFGAPSNAVTFEVTFGDIADHLESVRVYANAVTFLGSITNVQAQNGQSLMINTPFDFLRLVDTSTAADGSVDGFDLDAISVTPVPVPAAGFLLLAGLGGMAALRRRRKA